ncbi:hypothetical protein DACRYDRAFT_112230 [Dacryopinax primogenitus]|uniref:Alpha/beta-hydrolase n=1 Tax=Dacryopinax primogenitus (strain DJM 731) TaxID=1858805 RepID=M5FN62_DACPD|nr:uncharacterized protein DACRYDRAFT_112230 [Dacryopinax primogenitus]EJT96890.1 hypothetical protein DACRYDRAFT_112230 [Dacryopinax primogenitus]
MSFTWSTADLGVVVDGDDPITLRYGDTSPERSATPPYTTIIALHGSGFNATIRTHVASIILFEPPGLVYGIPLSEPLWEEDSRPAKVGRSFVDGLLRPLAAERVHLVYASVDKFELASQDLFTWDGVSTPDREAVSKLAFERIPPFLGLGVVYCSGTIIACIDGSKHVIDQCGNQVNVTTTVIPDGDHFLMATDPEAFNRAVISTIRELAAKVSDASS